MANPCDKPGRPPAYCELVYTPHFGLRWRVRACPYCGRSHIHSAGDLLADANDNLGHRIEHCGEGKGWGYNLRRVDDPQEARTLADYVRGKVRLRKRGRG